MGIKQSKPASWKGTTSPKSGRACSGPEREHGHLMPERLSDLSVGKIRWVWYSGPSEPSWKDCSAAPIASMSPQSLFSSKLASTESPCNAAPGSCPWAGHVPVCNSIHSLPFPCKQSFPHSLANWLQQGLNRRLEDGREEEARVFLPFPLCFGWYLQQWLCLLQASSSHQIGLPSMVLAASRSLQGDPALGLWWKQPPSLCSTSLGDDSDFLLLLISGWPHHPLLGFQIFQRRF